MTEEQLAELEIHLAAGTDLPTALAAIGDDRSQPAAPSRQPRWVTLLIFVIVLFGTLALVWPYHKGP